MNWPFVFATRNKRSSEVLSLVVAFSAVFITACADDKEAIDTTPDDSRQTTTTGTSPAPSTTTAPTSVVPSTTTNSTTTTVAATTTTLDEPIIWMPTGPGDPLIPRQYGGLLPEGNDDCEDLRRGPDGEVPDSFWDVARRVCLAVTTGADWPTVDEAPPVPHADGPFAACLDEEVLAVIDAALAWHHRHPDRQPEVSYAEAGALSACEGSIYELTAVLVGPQDFNGGSVGDVRIEFEIPSRPDFDSDEMVAELDGEEVSLKLDGVDPNRGTRRGRIILGDWGGGHIATVVLRIPTIERSGDVELPSGGSAPPDSPPTTT